MLKLLIEKLKEREETIRESWIRAMEARIVRDNLQKCYRVEGVNSLENCKTLAERYTQMFKENRVSDISYPPGCATYRFGRCTDSRTSTFRLGPTINALRPFVHHIPTSTSRCCATISCDLLFPSGIHVLSFPPNVQFLGYRYT